MRADSANRLISLNGTMSYAYNGLGDRLQQTVNGSTTTYALDLNTGLTQVLNDGTNTYLYGADRIAQMNTTTLVTGYFMTDALGSVRQLTDTGGAVTHAYFIPFVDNETRNRYDIASTEIQRIIGQ